MGRPTSFGAAQTGVYGAVGWITLYDSVDQVQTADAALAADKGFAELLDKEASKAYLAGVSTQTLYRELSRSSQAPVLHKALVSHVGGPGLRLLVLRTIGDEVSIAP